MYLTIPLSFINNELLTLSHFSIWVLNKFYILIRKQLYNIEIRNSLIFFSMKIIKKALSGQFLDVHLQSRKSQLVHIRILNLAGISKLSIWEVLEKGDNEFAIDISSLVKGPYKIIVDFAEENSGEEIFTLG